MLPEGKGAIHTAGSTLCHCTDPGCLMYFERDPTAPQAKLCEKCLQILKRTDLSKQISKFKAQKGGKA
jgi:predicted Zn-dependent protease